MEKDERYLQSMSSARALVQKDLELISAEMDLLAQRLHHDEMTQRLTTILSRKGKQVRSTLLTLLARTGVNEPDLARLAKTAASIELVHMASLLHDDVIDETELRRGIPTGHSQWGNKIAVLTGDYTLSCALTLVIGDQDQRLAMWVSTAASRLIAGEIAQLDFRNKVLSRADYGKVIDGKTASLIEAAAACGAILAGHNPELVQKCAELGRHFGLAFQIIDDLLDYGFGAMNLDKATLTDLKGGLMTLPLIYFCESASPAERERIQYLREHADQEESRTELLQKLMASGAFQSSFAEAQGHVNSAIQILEELPPSPATQTLMGLCQNILYRGN